MSFNNFLSGLQAGQQNKRNKAVYNQQMSQMQAKAAHDAKLRGYTDTAVKSFKSADRDWESY